MGEEAFLAAYRRHSEEESIEEVHLYPGAREMLEAVARFGGRNYLFTHRGESLFKYLQKDGITALFTDQVTSLDGFPSKPAPDALNFLIQKHGLGRAECVMVGDRMHDIAGGRANGLDTIGVLYGYGSREELVGAGAAMLAETPADLADLIL